MPLSEFYRLAKGKQNSSHPSAAASSPAGSGPSSSLHGTGSDFAELVWENGQMIRKGLPTTSLSNPSSHINITTSCLQEFPHNGRFRDKGAAKGDNSEMDFIMNDFQMNEHRDDITPSWLSYHLEDNNEPMRDDYSYNLFTEMSGVTAAEHSYHRTSGTLMERRSVDYLSFEQCDLPSVRPSNMSQLDRLLSLQNARCLNNTMQNIPCSESDKKRYLSSVHPTKKIQSQDLGQSSNVMNFPHFTAVVKPGVHAVSIKASPDVPIARSVNGKESVYVPICGKPASPSRVTSTFDGSKVSVSESFEILHHVGDGPSEVGCHGSIDIGVSPKQAITPNEKLPAVYFEKATEPVVVSSVCSGNSIDRASNVPTCDLKRKYTESDDSEFRSEDVEEESIGITKVDNNRASSGSKRSRAAEVHNLSERRRRDRINEKMRALQELIPNCNKVDKASMLDEAIEYLKTLQLQVQMISMGHGVCMPSMMFPHASPMPRFPPMGVGYGLGMLDMNMNSSTYPTMHIPQFPMAQVSGFGTMNLTQMPNLQMFGFQGQGVAMPTSHAPVVTSPACPPIRTVVDLNTASSAPPISFISSSNTSHPKDAVNNSTLEANDKSFQAVSLLKDDHPSTSKAKEPTTKRDIFDGNEREHAY